VGAGLALLYQAMEGNASVVNLGRTSLRTREVREEFLVFIDGLVAFGGALVELAQVIVGENSQRGETLHQDLTIFQVAFLKQYGM
jgi:predicted nucleic acid-binding protein